MDNMTGTEQARVEAITAARRDMKRRSFLEAQMALIEALGYKPGDGVCSVTLHITNNALPTVTVVRESYDANDLVTPFAQFTECYDLVRKDSGDEAAPTPASMGEQVKQVSAAYLDAVRLAQAKEVVDRLNAAPTEIVRPRVTFYVTPQGEMHYTLDAGKYLQTLSDSDARHYISLYGPATETPYLL